MAEALDLSTFVARPTRRHARIWISRSRASAAPPASARSRAGSSSLPGVVDARLNFTNRRLAVDWRGRELDAGRRHRGAGAARLSRASVRSRSGPRPTRPGRRSWLLRCLAVAGFAAMNIMLLSVSVWSGNVTDMTPETRDFFHWLSALIALPAAAYAGQPFFQQRAARRCAHAQLNMDVPISLGVLLALGMSLVETAHHAEHAYFDSAMMLLFFLLCGRYLDHAMRRKTRARRRQSRGAEGARSRTGSTATASWCACRPPRCRPATACWCGRASACRPTASCSTARPRSTRAWSPARPRARAVGAGDARSMPARIEFLRRADACRSTAAGSGTLLDEVERLLEKAVAAKSRYRAARRPRGAALCAGGARDRGADRARLARRRRVAARRRSSRRSRC